jgi:anaerobic selenocysteine-containing dehydrogenase
VDWLFVIVLLLGDLSLCRLKGPTPPCLIVVDPRVTATAKHAAVHLRPKPGTNLALLNGLQASVICYDSEK